MKRPIFIISGVPASGKTTVSKALMQCFSKGVHISVDALRGYVVSGFVDFAYGDEAIEMQRQFKLARQNAALIAKTYAEASFAVAIDDVIFPAQAAAHYDDALIAYELYKVVLRPDLEINFARNERRSHDNAEYALLENIIEPIYDLFDLNELYAEGWHVIDSCKLTVAETVTEILDQVGCFPN